MGKLSEKEIKWVELSVETFGLDVTLCLIVKLSNDGILDDDIAFLTNKWARHTDFLNRNYKEGSFRFPGDRM